MAINPSGNVGIGTTAPGAHLDIEDPGAMAFTGSTTKGVLIGAADSGAATNFVGLHIKAPYNSGTAMDGVIRMNRGSSDIFDGMEIGTYTNHPLRFVTNASTENAQERLRIDTSGNVGIGTTAPGMALDVQGAFRVTGTAGAISTSSTGNNFNFSRPGANYITATDAAGILSLGVAGANSAILIGQTAAINSLYLTGGNVGIGTTAPTAKLALAASPGAAGTAPLKLTTGTLMATAEDGALEYASSNLYYTIGATRYAIPMNTAPGNYSNVSTIGNASGSITMTPMAGNSVVVNSTTVSTSVTTGALIVNGGAGISGAVNASGNIMSGGSVTAATNMVSPQIYGSSAASGNIKIDGTSNATVGSVLLASAGGNVGIGTTSPISKVQIDKSGQLIGQTTPNGALLVSNLSNGNAGLELGVDNTNLGYIQSRNITSNTNYNLLLNPNGGNVGIGTTVPVDKLDIGGKQQVMGNEADPLKPYLGFGAYWDGATVRSEGTTNYGMVLRTERANTLAATKLHIAKADGGSVTNLVTYLANGNVGIGTTAPGASLDVKGHIANSGATATIGTCGTSPAITGNDTRGVITLGTGSPTACTITFASAYVTTPICVITPTGGDTGAVRWYVTPSTTALVMNFSATPTASQQFAYHCMQ